MTLRVDYDDFADTVVRLTGKREAYLQAHGPILRLTAADAKADIVVRSEATLDFASARIALEKENFLVLHGEWDPTADSLATVVELAEVSIAAVAYEAAGNKAGLWMDAYTHPPTEIEVLEAMFHEMRDNGEIPEITLEQFTAHICANVVVLTPDQIRNFLAAKVQPCP